MSADIGYEYFEYRVYLPIIGILVIIGILANETLNRFSINKLYKITLPVIAVYALITFIHTPVFTNSLTFFTSAIDANSKDALAFNSRGCVYRDAGNMELALADFDNSTKICPTYSSPYFGRADLYRTIGDNAKAEDFYARALNIDTLYRNINTLQDNAYLSLSAIKIVMNKNEEALNILKKAIDKYPHSFKIANNLGYVYSGFGKYDSAIICFNKAIETEPNSATYYNNRAKAKFHIKDYNGSLSDFYKALILDPGMKDAYLNRGKLKLETNDYYGAVSDLNTTLNMDSQSGEAYFYLGNAFSKINKQTEAENCWASAKKLGFTADK